MIDEVTARSLLAEELHSEEAVQNLSAEAIEAGWRFDWNPEAGTVPLGQTSFVVLHDGSVHSRRRTETVDQLLDRLRNDLT